jgi:anti-anti-sigma factor
MNSNAIPQTGSSVIASTLRYAMLCNPFPAADKGISNREPAPACAAQKEGIKPSEHVLRVMGFEEMTAANCAAFRKTACAAWKGHTDAEIDLSETTLIDCAGLGALIAVRNLTHARNGVARLMNPTPPVQQMLDLTRTGELFEIVNVPDANPALGAPGNN